METLIETIPAGIAVADADGIICLANQAVSQILGRPIGSNVHCPIEGCRILQLDETALPPQRSPLRRCLERGESCKDAEILLRSADGSERVLLVAANPDRDNLGRVSGMVLVLQDVTHRKRTEAKLHETQESLRAAQKVTHLGNWDWHLQDNHISWSDELYRVAGLAAEDVVITPRTILGLVHPDDRPMIESKLAAALYNGEPYHVTYRLVRPDGAIRVIEGNAEVFFDDSGKPTRMVGTAQDVTERKQIEDERERLLAEVALHRSRLESIVDRAPVGILFIDGANGSVIANQEAARIFGHAVRSEEECEQCLGQARHPDGQPVDIDDLPALRALRGETVDGAELFIVQPSGLSIPVRWSAVPIRGSHGEIVGDVSVFQDLSEIKQFERLRNEWTAMIAHDLRQPVAMMSLTAQLLHKDLDTAPSIRRWVEDIISDSRRLDRMIADLLDESRIETGRLRLRRECVDVAALVARIAARLARAYPERAIRFSQSGHIPAIELDPGRADQVLTNLITNAAKHGNEGTEIVVELDARDDAVELTVTNQGPGIPAEDLPRLFDRNYRTPGAQGAGTEGLGLGLYITRGIVEGHGGKIWAESDPGRTTRFHVVLPVCQRNTRPEE